MNLKALEEKRNDLKSQMGEMLETSKKEARALTTEEASKFDEMEKEIKNIDATIERKERGNSRKKRAEAEGRKGKGREDEGRDKDCRCSYDTDVKAFLRAKRQTS